MGGPPLRAGQGQPSVARLTYNNRPYCNRQFITFKFCSCQCRLVFAAVLSDTCHTLAELGYFSLLGLTSSAPSWPALGDLRWEVFYLNALNLPPIPTLSEFRYEPYICSFHDGPDQVVWPCFCHIWHLPFPSLGWRKAEDSPRNSGLFGLIPPGVNTMSQARTLMPNVLHV